MGPAQALFDHHGDWLSHTLAMSEQACPVAAVTLPEGGQLQRLGTGLLRYHPDAGTIPKTGLILSAGIHGNETAPIELLNALVNDLLQGRLTPQIPLLLVLGNPPAMVAGERFLEHNLNRLLCAAWQDYPDSYETRRAGQLEAVCREFADETSLPLRHYDLHTAIRPSKREKFALYPFVDGRQVPDSELDFLTDADIGTVLLQHRRATTFSGFSSEYLAAESFTLELGKVEPFGHNDLTRLGRLRGALINLLEQRPLATAAEPQRPEIFQVVHEVINTGEGFRFHVADDVANFTEYAPGTLIWEDADTQYRVGDQPEAVIFPNPEVPVGHRVALMIRKSYIGLAPRTTRYTSC
ncbi:succinylglutamate desuccinylase [Marinobacter segnicrescens]|uniref:succinylglutamate desuccinylase n=1 Tax=Marinobacter segnicrescens TaxID=430453 RepID=UPI003A8F8CC5